MEQLEDRLFLSAQGILPLISPTWFEQLSTSAASATASGALSVEQSTEKIQWKSEVLNVYTDEWIVQLNREALAGIDSVSEVAGLFAGEDFVFEVIGGLGIEGQFLLSTSRASVKSMDAWLGSSDAVAYFEPNAILPLERFPNDAGFSELWGLHNTGQQIGGSYGTADADIDAPEAWDIATGSANIVVGVVDTGVDYTHPDLAANIWTNPGEVAGNGIDDDGNGFVDDVHGYDFVNNDGDPMDDNSHGTHVSGTIAGIGNDGNGVAGVNWNSSIMALKFLSGGGWGSLSDAVRAINYATMMRTTYGVDIRLTSNSWGGGGYSQSMHDAIAASGQAGMMFVAAAGNSASDNDTDPHYPSSYNLDNLIAVAATDNRDNLASFSSYGLTSVDLAAPGVNVYSTTPGGGYAYYSGTSMATPHVSGVAALAWSIDPSATVAEIRAALLGAVDAKASLSGKVATGGRLNARATLELLGMNVAGSSPAAGSIVSSQISDFTIDFSESYDLGSVQASDLTVNGIAANSFTPVDGDTITFGFNVSPLISEGLQTMQIAEGAMLGSGGESVQAWQATFYYDQVAMAVTSTDPGQDDVRASPPTYVTLNFNEAVAAGSVGTNDLTLNAGSVTAATLLDADTVRYTVDISIADGQVTYTIGTGALTDVYGTPYQGYAGSFVIDDPTINRYTSTDTPLELVDYGTITSTIYVPDHLTVLDLDVELDITHTFDGDLDVYLITPNGAAIELFTDVGSGGTNFTQTLLDDEAATPITAGSAPFTGRFRPEGLLSDADGMDVAGNWTLMIIDDYWSDTGTLNSWAVTVKFSATPPPQQSEIHGTVWDDTDASGLRESGEQGLADETAYLDLNNNSARDNEHAIVASTDVPKNIYDNATTTSFLTISGVGGQVSDVNVTLDITHTWDSDLEVYLISPTGTRVELFSGVGDWGENFTNTTLDDEASTWIVQANAPFSGTFRPKGLLSSLDGEDPNGTWTLEVTDTWSSDQGTLNSWSLEIATDEPATQTDAQGNFAFTNLGPGNYYVRPEVPSGWAQTAPDAGYYYVNLQEGAVVDTAGFGMTQFDYTFDFGTSVSPVESGYSQVAKPTAYSGARGYGWLGGTLRQYDRQTGTNLTRDFIYTAYGSFAVDLANGTYDVTVTLGDVGGYHHDQMGVFVEGTQVDTVSTSAGQVVTQTYRVDVADGQLTLLLDDLGGPDPYVVIEALGITTVQTSPEHHYDFGTSVSPVESGHSQVTNATAYSGARGYGWLGGTLRQYDRQTGSNLTRDFIFTASGSFAVDLSNGTYDVTVTLGDVGGYHHDQMGIFLEGTQVDAVTTTAGQVVARTYQVAVTDNQLTLLLDDLGGTDPFVVIEGLDIEPSTAPPEPRYDFGTSVSPLESGYTRVMRSTTYSGALGYGWQSGTLSEYDRGTGTSLTRDFVYTRAGTFAVDLSNGTYDVTITLGDTGPFAHDQMGVFLEGTQLDTVTTTAGQVVTRTYQVAVADGQLTLLLDDLGGADPFLVIEAFEVSAAAGGQFGATVDRPPQDRAPVVRPDRYAWVDGLAWLSEISFPDDTATRSARAVDFVLQAENPLLSV